MSPFLPDNSSIMSYEPLKKTTYNQEHVTTPVVRASGVLRKDCSTEIIDVSQLSQRINTAIQYVEVADAEGRLCSVDDFVSTACWLKIVTLAKDFQSCNVILTTTETGVVLKTVRSIGPGEPLLMWFSENILAMLNMPFLTPKNIQGQNQYTCHLCNDMFEYPNPLKVHLALKCNRLDSNHLWSVLAKEFMATPTANLALSIPSLPQTSFMFELNTPVHPAARPPSISPILVETVDVRTSVRSTSPTSSNQPSPLPSNEPLLKSSTQASTSSSMQATPMRKNLGNRQSAFTPYTNQVGVYSNPVLVKGNEPIIPPYHVPPTAPPLLGTDVHAAQMETIVSNLGKSKEGHLCIYCGKVYSRKYGLKIHIRTHTGYKPLKCRFCLRPFGDPSNLNKHVRLHADGETPYRCNICGKILVRRRDLERHLKSRHQRNANPTSDTSSDVIKV